MNGDPLDELDDAWSEVKRLRLTDVERETIAELADDPDFYGLTRTHTKVLRGLLERHSTTSTR